MQSRYKYSESYYNCQIIDFDEISGVVTKVTDINATYPPTKVMWTPNPHIYHTDIFAYSGDYLRIYRLTEGSSIPIVDAILNKVGVFES